MSYRIADPADHLPHLVEHPPHPCPACHRYEPYVVHTAHVAWPCGHVQAIPTLGVRVEVPRGRYRPHSKKRGA